MPHPYDRIKERREALGLSQAELAARLGYADRSSIAKIESGVNDVSQSKLRAFADALETTPAYLMGWSDAKREVTDEDIKFALFGGAGEITDEMYEEVRQFAAYVKARRKGES